MAKKPKKICISCGSDKYVNHLGPRCRTCYRKFVNPSILERAKEARKKKGVTNVDKFNKGRCEAKLRKIAWSLTKEEYYEIIAAPCFYCGGPLPRTGVGLDRMSNNKEIGYCKDNVLPCCGSCNSIRGDKLTVAETIAAIHAIKEHRLSVIDKFHDEDVHIDSRTICLFDEVNDKTTLKICKAFDILESINQHAEITIKIMSPGGDWFAGLAIYDRIKQSPCPVVAIGTGRVGSTATAIFQAADRRLITENCIFVIHDGTDGFDGETKSFEAWGDVSKRSRKVLYDIYSETTKKPPKFWEEKCIKDTIFWAEEILSLGLAEGLVSDKKKT